VNRVAEKESYSMLIMSSVLAVNTLAVPAALSPGPRHLPRLRAVASSLPMRRLQER